MIGSVSMNVFASTILLALMGAGALTLRVLYLQDVIHKHEEDYHCLMNGKEHD